MKWIAIAISEATGMRKGQAVDFQSRVGVYTAAAGESAGASGAAVSSRGSSAVWRDIFLFFGSRDAAVAVGRRKNGRGILPDVEISRELAVSEFLDLKTVDPFVGDAIEM